MSESIHPNKGPFLRQLEAEDRFIGYYVLRSKKLEPFRDPSRGYFLTLILSDKSGQMVAHVWEGAEEVYDSLQRYEVVKVDGEVETYRNRLQIRILRVRPATSNEYDLQDMLPSTKKNVDSLLEQLSFFIEGITNPHLRALVGIFFNDPLFLNRFSQAPASRRIHHAYLGGLLEHTTEILTIAHTIVELYPQVDVDLLVTGALLHDVGKLHEFDWEFDIDYSDEGRLLGHIVITDRMVTSAIDRLSNFPPELALRVRHMLLAHHGRYEWGSPRRPKTIEAIALHHIENLSAQINRFHLLLEDRPEGESWTEYNRLLGRYIYGGREDDLNIEEQSLAE
jgi:3'-5' exoribonuclease